VSPKRSHATEAFWQWFGMQAAQGKVTAGDKDKANELQAAHRAGWEARELADRDERLRLGTDGPG
jgi:hypothetical protein